MAKKTKEPQPKQLTAEELAILDSKRAHIQIAALKKEICTLRGVVLQYQMKDQLDKIKDTAESQDRESELQLKKLKQYCDTLGEKYDVDFDKVTYDDITGDINLL